MSSDKRGQVLLVYGGQAGSEGKGAVCAWLALTGAFQNAVCSFQPNTGHTAQMGSERVVVHALPISLVHPHVKLHISAGAGLNASKTLDEIEQLDRQYGIQGRLFIDPLAHVVSERHILEETLEAGDRLGSTRQGVGQAMAARARRDEDLQFAGTHGMLSTYASISVAVRLNRGIDNGDHVLVEGSQGFDLDFFHPYEWPFCTSRGTTPMAELARCGLGAVDFKLAVVRAYPIRVGGNSGPYGDELSWEEVTERAGAPLLLQEYTTTTGRLRRIFEFDFARVAHMCKLTRPDGLALTFCDYIDWSVSRVREKKDIPESVRRFISVLEETTKVPVVLLRTGPDVHDTVTWREDAAERALPLH